MAPDRATRSQPPDAKAVAVGRFDVSDRTGTAVLLKVGSTWSLRIAIGALGGDATLTDPPLKNLDSRIVGAVRVAGEDRDWVLVRMATMANTIALRFYRFDRCKVQPVEVDGSVTDFVVGGGVMRGAAVECPSQPNPDSVIVRHADWSTGSASMTSLRWDGRQLSTNSTKAVALPSQRSPEAAAFYQISCHLVDGTSVHI